MGHSKQSKNNKQAKTSSSRKKSTSKSSSARQRQHQSEAWWKRAIRYIPAWVGLIFIIVLFVYDSFGDALPFAEEVRHDVLGREVQSSSTDNSDLYGGIYNTEAPLSRFFAESVLYWEPKIYEWAQENELNPNLVATVMQIESCGHPYAESIATAQGLFQVMPSNFQVGDNQLNPDQNAETGLQIMRDCLRWTTDLNLDQIAESEPDVGLALVCYNGGPSLIYLDQREWYPESQNYYIWGTGIWNDAAKGATSSPTLDAWMNSGGQLLCQQAIEALKMLDPLGRFD